MNSIAPIAEYPGLWLLAAVNFVALVVSIVGSLALWLKKKQTAWLPIGAALLLTYGLSWASKIRGGIVPALPYIRTERIGVGDQSIPSLTMHYSVDFIAIGLALGVLVAFRKKA